MKGAALGASVLIKRSKGVGVAFRKFRVSFGIRAIKFS